MARSEELIFTLEEEGMSPIDKIKCMEGNDSVKLVSALNDSELIIRIKAIYGFHCVPDNEYEPYDVYYITAQTGEKYRTSSKYLIDKIKELKGKVDSIGESIFNLDIKILGQKGNSEQKFLTAVIA